MYRGSLKACAKFAGRGGRPGSSTTDSVSTFAELNEVVQPILAYCEKKEVDPDDIRAKDVASSAALRRSATRAAKLTTKLDLSECAAYAELVAAVSKKRFKAASNSPVVKLAKRAVWLLPVAVRGGEAGKAVAQRPKPMRKALASLPAARVQALVEACIFEPEKLAPPKAGAQTADAGVVSASAAELVKLAGWRAGSSA